MEIWYTYMLMKDLRHPGKVMVKLGALLYAIGIHIITFIRSKFER